jgi:hypothetical protein
MPSPGCSVKSPNPTPKKEFAQPEKTDGKNFFKKYLRSPWKSKSSVCIFAGAFKERG